MKEHRSYESSLSRPRILSVESCDNVVVDMESLLDLERASRFRSRPMRLAQSRAILRHHNAAPVHLCAWTAISTAAALTVLVVVVVVKLHFQTAICVRCTLAQAAAQRKDYTHCSLRCGRPRRADHGTFHHKNVFNFEGRAMTQQSKQAPRWTIRWIVSPNWIIA